LLIAQNLKTLKRRWNRICLLRRSNYICIRDRISASIIGRFVISLIDTLDLFSR